MNTLSANYNIMHEITELYSHYLSSLIYADEYRNKLVSAYIFLLNSKSKISSDEYEKIKDTYDTLIKNHNISINIQNDIC